MPRRDVVGLKPRGYRKLKRGSTGSSMSYSPVAPVAYQVILEPAIGQLREFEPPRVHTRINFLGTLLCAQIDLRKARERELAKLDEKSTSSGIAEPYAR